LTKITKAFIKKKFGKRCKLLLRLCVELLLLVLLHPFNGLFSRTAWVSRCQKGKTSLDLNEARDDRVLGCSGISWTICSSLQTDNHTNTSSLSFYSPDAPVEILRKYFAVYSVEELFESVDSHIIIDFVKLS